MAHTAGGQDDDDGGDDDNDVMIMKYEHYEDGGALKLKVDGSTRR